MWETLSTKEVFRHPRLVVLEDTVRLPDGSTTDYLRFDQKGCSAGVICRNERGEYLLQREYCHPSGRVLWQFPGGYVHEGEDPEAGANRELMEESGWQAGNLVRLGSTLLNHRRSPLRAHVYLATDLEPASLPADREEAIESVWCAEDKVEDLIASGEMGDAACVASWALYLIHRRREGTK
jgi:ADP-ribose pyrophosphatase